MRSTVCVLVTAWSVSSCSCGQIFNSASQASPREKRNNYIFRYWTILLLLCSCCFLKSCDNTHAAFYWAKNVTFSVSIFSEKKKVQIGSQFYCLMVGMFPRGSARAQGKRYLMGNYWILLSKAFSLLHMIWVNFFMNTSEMSLTETKSQQNQRVFELFYKV